ncbi:MAG: MATE family efflux transporter [Verrucomicrobiota bacterium]|nr:MATE family efflux transporter [Verrucomicrobiota bacterium]
MKTQETTEQGFFASFKAAIRGDEKDFTQGTIKRALFMLAVPMILEMVMESLFAVVDVFYVSRIGVDAVATVGITESVMMIIYAIAVGLSMAATAFVARRAGEKKFDEAAKNAVQAIYLAFFISIPLSIAGIFFAPQIMKLMGASDSVVSIGSNFMRIELGANVIIMFLFLNNAIFRGAGDAAIAMRVLWLANILNMVLGPFFIFGLGPFPELGVTGAAVATTLGRGIAVLYQFRMLTSSKSLIRILAENWGLNSGTILEMFKVAIGGMSQFLLHSASWIVLMRILATFGSSAVAGYTIAIRIIVFTILPSWGLSNAAATLVGQNLGARQPDRAEKSVWTAAFYNMIFLTCVSIIFITFAYPILHLFTHDPDAVRNGVYCLRIICLGYIFFAYGMVISQSFNGAGDTKTPTLMNFICFWVVQLPLAWVLSRYFNLGTTGVYISQSVAFSLMAFISIYLFRKGDWKQVKV